MIFLEKYDIIIIENKKRGIKMGFIIGFSFLTLGWITATLILIFGETYNPDNYYDEDEIWNKEGE